MVDAILSGGEFGGEVVTHVSVGDEIKKVDAGNNTWVYLVTKDVSDGRNIAVFTQVVPQ
jgi:hypothetical protein